MAKCLLPLKVSRVCAAAGNVPNSSSPPQSSRTQSLSPHQRSVLACLEQGLGEEAVCNETGLDPKSVALAIGDLRALRLVDETLRPSHLPPPPASRSSSAHHRAERPFTAQAESLPPGIEPWSGDDMPEGSISPEAPDAQNSNSNSSSPPPLRASTLPPLSRGLPAEALNYRKLYDQAYRDQTVEERMVHAQTATGSDLLALCLDPSPRVVGALLDNPQFALDHARTVASHHGTPSGLEQLCRHTQFLRDAHVHRRLLQNAQLPEGVLLRLLKGRRLLSVYRSCVDRDLPERNRTRIRTQLRPCFTRAEPSERAALVLKTEGRCLGQLAGCTFDGKTTQLLCTHNYSSTLLIQNLARFAATPPVLLAKLARSGPVRRQAQLKALVQRHPNFGGTSPK